QSRTSIVRCSIASCGSSSARPSCPTRRSSDLGERPQMPIVVAEGRVETQGVSCAMWNNWIASASETLSPAEAIQLFHIAQDTPRSEEHTSELQSRFELVCRLLLEKKKRQTIIP